MTYIVHDVYRHSEDSELMVAYQALYPTVKYAEEGVFEESGVNYKAPVTETYEKHVRPLSMFTTDRFVRLGHFDHILRAMNNAL